MSETGAMSEERLREIEEFTEALIEMQHEAEYERSAEAQAIGYFSPRGTPEAQAEMDEFVEGMPDTIKELTREVRRLRAARGHYYDDHLIALLDWILAHNDLTFAECSLAEGIMHRVRIVRETLAQRGGAASEEWVAVEERLPSVGGTYWVHAFAKNPFVPGRGFCAVGYYVIFEDGGKWSASGTWPDETLDRVTHWRELAKPPLPQPPGSSPKEGK